MRTKPNPSQALAVIHNEFARSRNDLGIVALRLVMLLAERIREDADLLSHRFRVADYAEKLNLCGHSTYERLEAICDQLMTTLIETRIDVNHRRKFQLVSMADYWEGTGEVELRFHEEMRPLLVDLRSHFAKIPSDVFFRIQGSYAARFYLVCKSWDPTSNKIPGWQWTINELRYWLWLPENEYKEVKNIRTAILERAKKELDEVADVSFRYDPMWEGKKVVGWSFTPLSNKPKSTLLPGKKRQQKKQVSQKIKESEILDQKFGGIFSKLSQLWSEASGDQQQEWLNAMPKNMRDFAPKDGACPNRIFLSMLQTILETTV